MRCRHDEILRNAALAALAATFLGACGGAAGGDAPKLYQAGPLGIDQALADLNASETEIAARLGGDLRSSYPERVGAEGQPGQSQPQPAAPASGLGSPPPPDPFPGQMPRPTTPARGTDPPPAPPPAPADAPASGYDEEAESKGLEKDRCAIACRALSSMKRAADHVCSAAGTSDPRCGRARARVASATVRVEASCEDCDG